MGGEGGEGESQFFKKEQGGAKIRKKQKNHSISGILSTLHFLIFY